jgi:hypothetical protein
VKSFKSYRSYDHFAHVVSREWRYVRTAEQDEFLATILETSQNRRLTLPPGTILWRAQIGNSWEAEEDGEETISIPFGFPPERMKPLAYEASEGRANSKGIPVLYMATQQETAVAEVRPWVGLLVSVAQLKVLRSLELVNCAANTVDEDTFAIYSSDYEPDPEEREQAVWQDIDRAFSRPVNTSDRSADYVPTQIIAELFKQQGLDGVAYRSSLGPGLNIALFDLDAADVVSCTVLEVMSLKFNSHEIANPYVVSKYYPRHSSR